MTELGSRVRTGSPVTRGSGRIAELDGLRGVAVLLVLGSHTASRTIPYGGVMGVTVFFVLSGYLITSRLLREHEKRGRIDLLQFWERRVVRLAPAFIAVLLALLVLAAVLDDPRAAIYRDLVTPLLFQAGDYLRASGVELGAYDHTWSLAVEEQFYLIWPIVLVLALRRPSRKVLTLLLVVALAWRAVAMCTMPNDWVAYSLDTNAYALLLGAVLAVRTGADLPVQSSTRSDWLAALPRGSGVVALAVVAVGTVCTVPFVEGKQDGASRLLEPAAALLAVVIIAAAMRGVAVLRSPILRWFGTISYGLYLWHYIVLSVRPNGVESSGPLRLVLAAVSIGIAAASWYWFERPIARAWAAYRRH